MTKAEKLNKQILEIFRGLVAKARTDEMEYEEFKATSDNLASLYQELLPKTSFKGFSLSDRQKLIHLDPDQYLSPGSFMQKMVVFHLQKRTDEIVEDGLAVLIYRLLLKLNGGSMENVSLYTGESLETAASPAVPTTGTILSIQLAGRQEFRERVSLIGSTCIRVLDAPILAVTGVRDEIPVNPERFGDFTERLLPVLGSCFRENSRRGTIIPGSTIETSDSDHHVGRSVLISKCQYRSTTGELHELDFSTNPVTQGDLLAQIATIEGRPVPEGASTPVAEGGPRPVPMPEAMRRVVAGAAR